MNTIKVFWVSLMLLAWAVLFVAQDVAAQSPPGDLPRLAQDEIARRGNHVELTGTIRSGLMAMALAPPADDSAKWFLTLVLKPGETGSERMRHTLANDPALRPWVDTREPSKSTMHYHVRSVDDATQADWLKGLRPAIARMGLPLIVLQPPKNGQFGPTSTIVKLVAGVSTGEQLATKLRDGIVAYVHALESPGEFSSGPASPNPDGHAQAVIGVPPPFNVPPKDPPPNPAPLVPFDWPPTVPPSPSPNPSPPASDSPSPWLALVSLGIYIAGWVSARMKTKLGEKLAALATLIETVKRMPPGPSNPSP